MTVSLVLSFLLAALAASAQVAPSAPVADAIHTLSETQKQALKSIMDEAKKKAEPLALRLGQTAKQVYENFLSDNPDEELRLKLSDQMKEIAGELLAIKGQSIHDAVGVLTPEQKRLLRREMEKPGAPIDLVEVMGKVFKVPEK